MTASYMSSFRLGGTFLLSLGYGYTSRGMRTRHRPSESLRVSHFPKRSSARGLGFHGPRWPRASLPLACSSERCDRMTCTARSSQQGRSGMQRSCGKSSMTSPVAPKALPRSTRHVLRAEREFPDLAASRSASSTAVADIWTSISVAGRWRSTGPCTNDPKSSPTICSGTTTSFSQAIGCCGSQH